MSVTVSRKADPPEHEDVVANPNLDPPQYPQWISQKFTPDGAVLPFPGNTIVCHVPPQSTLFNALEKLCDDINSQSFSTLFTFLPASSWHMTVFEGVCDQVRTNDRWPGDLPLDASLAACTDHVAEKLRAFDLGSTLPFNVTIMGWQPLEDGIALSIGPADDQEEDKLRKLRDRIAECLELQHPGHEQYAFHISLAYTLRYLSQNQLEEVARYLKHRLTELPDWFELGAPEFCTFRDMFAFERQFFLR